MKIKNTLEQPMLMGKWSSKPAEHNANRVRNNQRRHRARVKSRMEELEARFQETNAKLEAALATISTLTSELEALRASRSSTSSHLVFPRPSEPPSLPKSAPSVLDHDNHYIEMTSTLSDPSGSEVETLTPTSEATTHKAGLAVPASAVVDNDSFCNCADDAPPPALGESTISCSSALQIIEQQNFSGVEVTTIKAWLGPGFRLKPGESCRVETNRLYELLDHITSLS